MWRRGIVTHEGFKNLKLSLTPLPEKTKPIVVKIISNLIKIISNVI